jgi:RimJ/RimL family protein N-acetyltransferase
VDDAWVRQRAEDGYFWGPTTVSWWLDGDGGEPVGLFRVFELSDLTPLIDLRIAEASRGLGIGTEALRAGTSRVFETMPEVSRLAGYTRYDNVAMQRVFVKAGWVKEAHHRRAWRVLGREPVDSVGFAMLHMDWQIGS